jgi:hypothetical protein
VPAATPFRPGTQFKDGRLIDFSGYAITVMRGWPAPLAWRRTSRTAFRPVRPFLRLDPLEDAAATDPYVRFMAPVPAAAQAAIFQFRQRHWHMLALLARCDGALELAHSNPALAFMLASNWVFRPQPPTRPLDCARRLLRRRRRDICAWLGFPNSAATARLLARIPPAAVRIDSLLYLRQALADPAVRKLAGHLPRLGADVLRILADPALLALVRPSFLLELAAMPADAAWPEVAHRLRTVAGAVLQPLRGLSELRELEEDITTGRPSGPPPLRHLALTFPPPPLRGSAAVHPITTPFDLNLEGIEMDHCVAGWAPLVARGDVYVYRVLAPERATAALVRLPFGWALDEIRGYGNATVADATLDALVGWLNWSRRAAAPSETDASAA